MSLYIFFGQFVNIGERESIVRDNDIISQCLYCVFIPGDIDNLVLDPMRANIFSHTCPQPVSGLC